MRRLFEKLLKKSRIVKKFTMELKILLFLAQKIKKKSIIKLQAENNVLYFFNEKMILINFITARGFQWLKKI